MPQSGYEKARAVANSFSGARVAGESNLGTNVASDIAETARQMADDEIDDLASQNPF